jgi:hypothetical protein
MPPRAIAKIHVNMSWGGSDDNYCYLDAPVQTGVYIFPADPGNLTINYPVKPCSGEDCDPNLEAGDGIVDIAGPLGNDLSGLEYPRGDINGDTLLNLADAILALKVIAGMNPQGIRSDNGSSGTDIDGNGRIGLEEAIFILQDLAV